MDAESFDTSKLNDKQKLRLEKMKSKIDKLEASRMKILQSAGKATRADLTRRKIVIGAIVLKHIEEAGWAETQSIFHALLSEVLPEQQYLFKEKWPNATKPHRGAKGKEAPQPTGTPA